MFNNTERQANYNRASKIIDNDNIDELTEEIILISIDLMSYDEALEEIEELRKSRNLSRLSYELSRSSLLKERQVLIDERKKLQNKKSSEYSLKIG